MFESRESVTTVKASDTSLDSALPPLRTAPHKGPEDTHDHPREVIRTVPRGMETRGITRRATTTNNGAAITRNQQLESTRFKSKRNLPHLQTSQTPPKTSSHAFAHSARNFQATNEWSLPIN